MQDKSNQKKVYVFLAEGFETIEALTLVDILRRVDWPVYTVSATGEQTVVSGQGIPVLCDLMLDDLPWAEEVGALFIPGGLPAAQTLSENEKIIAYIQECEAAGALIVSICAGPLALQSAGLAARYRGTCYPGVEETVRYREYSDAPVCEDGQLITSRGPATSLYLALSVLRRLAGERRMLAIKEGIQQTYLEEQGFPSL